MAIKNTVEEDIENLSEIIDKKFTEFENKINTLRVNDFENLNSMLHYAYELSESYRYEFRRYVNENFIGEPNILFNGLAYTHPINGTNFTLQILVSQKHKQFDTLYHQYAQDLNPQL